MVVPVAPMLMPAFCMNMAVIAVRMAFPMRMGVIVAVWMGMRHGSKAPGLLHIGAQDGEEFLGRLGSGCAICLSFEKMAAQMMFDQFVAQATHGPADGGYEMHNLPAARIGKQGALDRVHLAPQATDSGQKLGLVLRGVGQSRLPE